MFKCGLNLLLPNFNGCTVEAWRLLINFIPHLTGCVFTYSCQVIRVSKMAKCLGWVFSDYLWRHSVTHFPHYITVTLWWAPWRLKSPASPWFTQPFIHMTSSLSRFWLSDLASCWVVRLNKDRVWLKNCFKTIEFCAANHCFLFSFSLVNWILRQNRKRNTNLFIWNIVGIIFANWINYARCQLLVGVSIVVCMNIWLSVEICRKTKE